MTREPTGNSARRTRCHPRLSFAANNMRVIQDKRGVVTLVTTVIIFLVCLALAEGIQFLGVGELQNGFTADLSMQSFALADGCAEEALERLTLSDTYTGETITLGNDSCTVAVSGAGGTRQIDATSSVNSSIVRRI